jgi:hypothetical protein
MAAFMQEIREEAPVAQTVKATVIAQDPSVKTPDGRILTTEVRIPAEPLDPGPRGSRLHVVDFDGGTGKLGPPTLLDLEDGDAFVDATDETLVNSPDFRAQNVYAIASRTLATFEGALGRRLDWSFNEHQLYLVPRAMPEANAFYSPEDHAVLFGYVPGAEGETDVHSALSHDIVAHEVTHAILDGLRPRYSEPSLPDQAAFHEALGDIVALLSVFSLQPVVERLLGDTGRGPNVAKKFLTEESLHQTALMSVAEELGQRGERGSALRRSVTLAIPAGWRQERPFEEAHRRAEIVVAAVSRTLLRVWVERLEALMREQGADRARVAEEGAQAAEQLLRMVIRGLDYMPPVELEFEDVIDAIVHADQIVRPDNDRYRRPLELAFGEFGIARPPGRLTDVSKGGAAPVYERMNHTQLTSDPDEVARFIWENAGVFGIERGRWTHVEAVRPTSRIGENGLIVNEVVADYVQSVRLRAHELGAYGLTTPRPLEPDTEIELWGGGVLVFDGFGRAKFHQTKPLQDWDRQQRRLDYLVSHRLRDTRGNYGATLSIPSGQRFAALHVADERAGEDW